jgi:hypothetical protein
MSGVFLSKNDSTPYEYINNLQFPKDIIINNSTSNSEQFNEVFEYEDYFYLIVEDVQDENILKHLRLKVEAEEMNLGVSFWICLSKDDGSPTRDWKKIIDLYYVPNNSKIKIWYKWTILNNIFLTKTGNFTIQVNVYSVQEQ